MKTEWKKCKLGEVASFQNGFAFKSQDFKSKGKYHIIRIKELKNGFVKFFDDTVKIQDLGTCIEEKFLVNKNDILFALTGDPINKNNPLSWVGRVAKYTYNDLALLNQRVAKLIPSETIDKDFIYYHFRCFDNFYSLASKATGSASQANISTKTIENEEIFLPPLPVQKKIAAILSSFDNKIELNKQINNNLLAQAQALYNQCFPYRVDDDLPTGWRIGTIGEIIEIHDSKRIPLSGAERAKMEKKTYPYYGAAALMDYVDDYIFDGKYLLLGEDGTVVDEAGYPILQYVWGKFWVNNHAHILTGKLGFNVESLYMLFKQTPVKAIVTGAVQPKISQANLRSIQVVIPPQKLLMDYNNQIAPLFTLLRTNEEANKSLAALRDTLLPKLMSGEIDVSDVQL